MTRAATPLRRLGGAAASWALFAFFVTGLLLVSTAVIAMGGTCASGGPYVIANPCPGSVLLFVPIGIVGMLAAVGISMGLAGDFAAPLYAWAWPVLFTGLGVVFVLAAASGIGVISNLLVAVLALAMGLGPLAGLRGGGLRTFLVGSRTVTGEPFDAPDPRSRLLRPRTPSDAAPVPLTPGRVALAVGIPLVASAVGSGLGALTVTALG